MVWSSSFFYRATKQSTPRLFVALTQQIEASSTGGNKRRQRQPQAAQLQMAKQSATMSQLIDRMNERTKERMNDNNNTRRQQKSKHNNQLLTATDRTNERMNKQQQKQHSATTTTTTTPTQQSTIRFHRTLCPRLCPSTAASGDNDKRRQRHATRQQAATTTSGDNDKRRQRHPTTMTYSTINCSFRPNGKTFGDHGTATAPYSTPKRLPIVRPTTLRSMY